MDINDAKSKLENEIILWDGVKGVGVIISNGCDALEVAIEKNNSEVKNKINQLLTENCWNGYKVKIIPTDGFKFH